MAGSGAVVVVMAPSGPCDDDAVAVAPAASSVVGKSSRLCAPRLSVRCRALRVIASDTISRLRSSKTRFQPGL